MGDVTEILRASRQGETLALDRIVSLLYPQLRRIAHARLRHRDDRLLMDTGALVNETYLHLVGKETLHANDSGHFLAYAAQVMRNLVVDTVRRRQAQRRGGGLAAFVTLDTSALGSAPSPEGDKEILKVHDALEELAQIDERLLRVVELRYFAGLTTDEIAACLGVSRNTVTRDWDKARIYLLNVLRET